MGFLGLNGGSVAAVAAMVAAAAASLSSPAWSPARLVRTQASVNTDRTGMGAGNQFVLILPVVAIAAAVFLPFSLRLLLLQLLAVAHARS